VLPDTESINPFTQSLPFAEADGDDDEVAELVGFVEVGFASLDAPHAATDSAVAPVTASSATRDSRAGGQVTDIEDPSQLAAAPRQATFLTIGGIAESRPAPDYEPAVYPVRPRESGGTNRVWC
jgi:hypothetical protein